MLSLLWNISNLTQVSASFLALVILVTAAAVPGSSLVGWSFMEPFWALHPTPSSVVHSTPVLGFVGRRMLLSLCGNWLMAPEINGL